MKIGPKHLSVFDLSMIVVSLILGMGIFRTPATVARDAGSPFIFFSAWIFGALIALFGAITFAEIGSRFPRTGGSYKILAEAYNPTFAFMVNWIQVFSNAASIGAISLVASGYLSALLRIAPENYMVQKAFAISLILVLYAISRMGLKVTAATQNILSVLKIVMVLMLCAGVFFVSGKPDQIFFGAQTSPGNYMNAFTVSLMGVFFTYEGYQWVINFGGETINPSRTIPKALLSGISMILVLYLALNYSFYHLIGFHELSQSFSPASLIAGDLFGRWGIMIASLIIFLSISGYAHAGMMSNPRMYTAMAEDGVLPPLFLKESKASGVKVSVLNLFTFFILISLVFANTFEKLLEYIILFDNIGLAAAAGCIFIFRRRNTGSNNLSLFKLKFYPLIPVLFLSALALVSLGIALRSWRSALYGSLFFLFGWPLFHLLKRFSSQAKYTD